MTKSRQILGILTVGDCGVMGILYQAGGQRSSLASPIDFG